MKLVVIDIDKLNLKYVPGHYIGGGMWDGEGYMLESDNLNNAIVAQAIPVRWIEDYIEERTNVFGDMNVALMLKRWKEGYKPSVPDIGGKENADVC